MQQVPISDEQIRLGQFLKLAGVVDVGSQVKDLLAEQVVLVNGKPEDRRGRQLVRNDVITVGNEQFVVG